MLKLIFYTDSNILIPKVHGACTRAFIVFIRPKYEGNLPLLEHELTHVKQFWRTFGLFPFLYLVSKKYRLKSEVEAYRTQLQVYADAGYPADHLIDKAKAYAGFISSKYGLRVTWANAYKLLTSN
jgi:hypothetical protein